MPAPHKLKENYSFVLTQCSACAISVLPGRSLCVTLKRTAQAAIRPGPIGFSGAGRSSKVIATPDAAGSNPVRRGACSSDGRAPEFAFGRSQDRATSIRISGAGRSGSVIALPVRIRLGPPSFGPIAPTVEQIACAAACPRWILVCEFGPGGPEIEGYRIERHFGGGRGFDPRRRKT